MDERTPSDYGRALSSRSISSAQASNAGGAARPPPPRRPAPRPPPLDEAFTFHQAIGKSRVTQRIYELNQQLKQGLAKMTHVTLHTPMSQDLSAGIVCFEVAGMTPRQVIERLRQRKIIGSVTPYATQYARLAPSLLTLTTDIEQALDELLKLRV